MIETPSGSSMADPPRSSSSSWNERPVAGALLVLGFLPVAVGWASIAFVLAWGILYLGRVSFFIAPLGPSLAILVIGLYLLLRPTTID